MHRARYKRWDSWEVSLHGDVIGWVQELHLRGAVKPFYRATGIHRVSGRRVPLELSTDREERIRVVLNFWVDPMSRPQHLPRELKPND